MLNRKSTVYQPAIINKMMVSKKKSICTKYYGEKINKI